MDTRELEAVVRTAWLSSQLPLTSAVLESLSGLPRADVEHGMRQLMRKGIVDMDVGADGAIQWCVRGLKRMPPAAPAAPAAPAPATAPDPAAPIAVAPPPPPPPPMSERVAGPRISVGVPGTGIRVGIDPEKKSLLMSAGLSLVFGPFGWIYAGPWKEVVPGIILYVGLVAILPKFLIGTLLGLLHPTCGVLGTLYAWRFNRTKQRTPLLLVDR